MKKENKSVCSDEVEVAITKNKQRYVLHPYSPVCGNCVNLLINNVDVLTLMEKEDYACVVKAVKTGQNLGCKIGVFLVEVQASCALHTNYDEYNRAKLGRIVNGLL